MDDVTRNRIDAFDRCEQWFDDNAVGVSILEKRAIRRSPAQEKGITNALEH
ncbi:MAG: hypothetical protein IT173_16935 [Acidobacteria bacterium]|nr:hypothetical protein [Acidobacteriota bacterium]